MCCDMLFFACATLLKFIYVVKNSSNFWLEQFSCIPVSIQIHPVTSHDNYLLEIK